MSKLYTEEQVTNLTESAFMAGQNHNPFIFQIELNKLTPIELPTNEEIERKSVEYSTDTETKEFYKDCCWDFQNGAKWMRDKIKAGSNSEIPNFS